MTIFQKSRQGFTLLELSITLIIIGLLVGGVLVGKNLIRSAELRSIPNDIGKFSAATVAFKTKYQYLPGDFPNATSLWGTNPNCATQGLVLTTLTCNGNGDGGIAFLCPSGGCLAPSPYFGGPDIERLLFWQHLANAGFIEGEYTGTEAPCHPANATCNNAEKVGYTSPTSKITGTGYGLEYSGMPGTNWFILGGVTIPADRPPPCYTDPDGILHCSMCFDCNPSALIGSANSLTPSEAWSLDNKMDDGKSNSGKVLASGTNCTAWNGSAYEYKLDYQGIACAMRFKAGF